VDHHRHIENAGRSGCHTDPPEPEQLTLEAVAPVAGSDVRSLTSAPTPNGMGEAMLGLESYLASRNYAPTSLKQRRVILGQFVAAVGDPATCDAEAVMAWWAGTERLAPASRRAALTAVRGLLAWLVEAGVRADNPAQLIATPRVPRTMPKVLTGAEVTALRRAVATPTEHLLVELGLTLGLRTAEIASLDADDLHRAEEMLTVQGKGGKVAMIPVPTWMVEAWPPPGSGPVFGCKPKTVRKWIVAVMHRAGIVGHTPHSLRRTCGTELAKRAPLHVVAALLRHDSVSTTTGHYTAVSAEDLRRAIGE
jgi:integrase/recombinase XerD